MKEIKYKILVTPEYAEWFNEQSAKSQVQINDRLSRVRENGYFGDHKDVGEAVWELKWANGRRVYYAYIPEKKILLILGGNKNGQDKDIRQARKILRANIQR
jgi:putative addiction module killer protein